MRPRSTDPRPEAAAGRALRMSEARYRRLFETAQDGILLINADTAQIEDVNPYLVKMLGYSHAEFLGKKLWEVGPFADFAESKAMFAELQTSGYVRYEHLPLKTKAGTPVAVEFVSNSYSCEDVKVVQCNIRDISARRAAEEQAGQHSRLYAALSQCNHVIVHCSTKEELFPEICRIAVELGGASMAWIGLVVADTLSVLPVASWGDTDGYLKGIQISMRDDTPFGRGPVGRAMRENQPVWLQDIMHAPAMEPWRERMEPSGWTTSAALPLRTGGIAVGVLNVYSDQATFFDEPARDLLRQLAMDISFALDGFARETRRKQAEEALQASKDEFLTLAEAVPQIVWATQPDGSNIYFNKRWEDYTGLAIEESHGDAWIRQFHPAEQPQIREDWRRAASGNDTYERENRLRDAQGLYRWFLTRGVAQRDVAGRIVKWFGTCTDIHELTSAKLKIRRLNRVYAVLSSINSLIIRATNREELFREMCRIAIEVGGFSACTMSLVEPHTMTLILVASEGRNEPFLERLRSALASPDEAPKTLTARAVREKTPVIVNDYERDPRALHGREWAAFGARSMVALPVMKSGEAVAVLALYAESVDFFDEEEMGLLKELIGDIAFAVDTIGKEERLRYLAYYDELTGLANRSLFLERLGQCLRAETSGRHKVALLIINLDRFKNVNDSLGRAAGDELLKQVAGWLSQNRGDANLVGRLGADHFGVVLPNVAAGRDLERRLDDVLRALVAHPFCLEGTELRVSATAGLALFPNDGGDAETLFRNAEAALKNAKARGGRFRLYSPTMTQAVQDKLSRETRLRDALEKQQFVLHLQPKVGLASGKVTSSEALVRWNDPHAGLVLPGQFVPSLEETGLIYEVGNWVLASAVDLYLRWRAQGIATGRIAVNVSPVQLRDPDFITELKRIISQDPHAAAGLELEITESVIMEDITTSVTNLHAIRAMGITVAIDDFGTGFSSLSYLAKLPVDGLKIDISFIREMTRSPVGLTLVSTIISLAHGLKLKVVAEGVETDEQFRLLRLLECDEMQGYFFSKPIPIDLFERTYLNAEGT
ncbi:EAL domain-containing protein [Ancylobacter pratisalsi]|uniref:EAL domain-containing protein n=1 Tax=Ancylobacter pratisalsi TaxID=1745854 RepID=A0A6P1YM14_9HYPH|nr:EAL domain-containing protein [Ancylobacter pratisalsi]QIB34175.1 EAL domain-containing protein [Ancylobacter pratisalsi]